MEIERKFLCTVPSFDLKGFKSAHIIQYYISTDPVIRIRRTDAGFYLTVKGKGEIAREEFEMPLTENQFLCLREKAGYPPIDKTRYFIPLENGLTAELDIYYGALSGLLTVEVEFDSLSAAESFTPPEWFGRDISGDNRYKNASLYINGIPEKIK